MQYYSFSWKDFGVTDTSGAVSIHLLPLSYKFRMTCNVDMQYINQDVGDSAGREMPSGIYFYRITADDGRFTQTKKMVLMK